MKTFYHVFRVCVLIAIMTVPTWARRGNPVPFYSPGSLMYVIDSDDNDPRTPTYNFTDTTYGTGWTRITSFSNNDNGTATLPASGQIMNFMNGYYAIPPKYVTTNGLATFDVAITSAANDVFPLSNNLSDSTMIAPLWTDLEMRAPGDSSKVYYRTVTDTCYVSFFNMFLKNTNGKCRATFQIVFCVSDSSVTYQYKSFDGEMCGVPAAKAFQNQVTIGVEGVFGAAGTNYLNKGTYYARSYSSSLYAKPLHNALAVKFMRAIANWSQTTDITYPAYNGIELSTNTFIPKAVVKNLTDSIRRISINYLVTNISTGISIFNRTDSINVDPGSTKEDTTVLPQLGFPCGAYRMTVTSSIKSKGADAWTADNIMIRDFVLMNKPAFAFFDDYSSLDRCNWNIVGASKDSNQLVFNVPASPRLTDALIMDRLNDNGDEYVGSTVGDTITTGPMDLSGLQNKTNVWLEFSYQRGLATDSTEAGITNRTMSGPEPIIIDGTGAVTRGDSLVIEALTSAANQWNPPSNGWVPIGKIYGGLDYTTTKYRLNIPQTYVHNHTRLRLRVAAKNDGAQYCAPFEDRDAFAIDGLQISAPENGKKADTDLEPISMDLGTGFYTHVPRDVKNIVPKVKIASNGLSVNLSVYLARLVIKDDLNREVYHRTKSFIAPAARTDTTLAFPTWDIQGSQGGVFKATVDMEQCFTEYRRANDTNTFIKKLYIDDMYAVDDNGPDTSGTMSLADNNFYYSFKPLVSDSLRGFAFYHMTSSGLTNWTTVIKDNAGNTIGTRSFSYNVLDPGWNRQTFTPLYLIGDSTYKIQFTMTQGSSLGGDGSRGLVWVKTDNGTSKTYDALYPSVASSFYDVNNASYYTAASPKNATGGGPLLPMMRLIYRGSSQFLPVELVSFGAIRTMDGAVNLNFRTAKEEDLQNFDLERENGDSWDQIGSVNGKNAANGASYAFLDGGAPRSAVTYRLWENDLDGSHRMIGTTTASPLAGGEMLTLSVFPNPASTVMNVVLGGAGESATLSLYDETGRTVTEIGNVHDGKTQIGLRSIPQGTYYLDARTSNGTIKAKVVVNK